MQRILKEIMDILVDGRVFTHHPKASNPYKVVLRPYIWGTLLEDTFKKYPDLKEYSNTFPTIQEFLYCVASNLSEPPRCPICGSNCKFETNGGRYYRDTCCRVECQNESKRRKCLEKYGVNNPSQLKWVQEKKEKTCLKNYGAKIPFQTEKVKKINRDIRALKGKEMIDKTHRTMLKRYGVSNPSQVREFQVKKSQRYYYRGIKFDSKPELAYYIWLKDHNIDFTYHTEKLEYVDGLGKIHYYYPDFRVGGELVEIKSPMFFNDEGKPLDPYTKLSWQDKYNCMLYNNVIIVTDYSQYLQYITDTYGAHYLEQFRHTII